MTKLQDAQALLVRASDKTLDLAARQGFYNDADKLRKELHVGWGKIGDVPEDITAAITSTTTAAAAPTKAPKAPKAPKVVAEKAPLVPGRLVLRNAIQVALFTQVILPQMTMAGGKWEKTRPADHAAPWTIAVVSATDNPKDDSTVGIDFEAVKTNYNVNDSNFTNVPENLSKLLSVAKEANGGVDVPKKGVIAELVDMKAIFGKRIPAIVAEAAPEAPVSEVQEPAAE